MIKNKATTQYILSNLTRREKNVYADFLAMSDTARTRLMSGSPSLNNEEAFMRETVQKVEQLQAACITSVFKD